MSGPRNARLGLGLAAVGRPAYINLGRAGDLPGDRSVPALERRAHEVLDAAWAAGITYVDAARSYGKAEEFLASWLSRSGHTPFVASKWGYRYTADWRADAERHEVKDHGADWFARQWAESQELLGDTLKLYQVHSLTLDSPLWEDVDLHHRLAALSDRGMQVGFSTSGPAQADAVRRGLDLEVAGRQVFSSVQSTWNLLERSVAPALREAADAGWRVVVKEAMANGRLIDHPALAEAADRAGVGPTL